MADYGVNYTDAELKKFEKKINEVYKQASADIDKKIKDFNDKYKVKEAKHLKELAAGKITQEQFDGWKAGQVFQGKQWQAKKDQIVDTLFHANETATKIMNGQMVNVFTANANFMSYSLESQANINFGFGIYDSAAVSNLLKNDPQLLPEWKINEPKDYTWNYKNVNNAVTQGIIQGERLDQIAKRFSDGLATTNKKKMMTFARTSMTAAQNEGRLYSLNAAKDLDINVEKEWMCTLDGRTRDWHRQLDGQKKPLNKPFEVDGMKIRFPGDPQAKPGLVYNCRCTMVGDLVDYPSEYERYDNIKGKPIKNMTYKEWEALNIKLADEADSIVRMLDESEAKGLLSIFSGKKMSNVYNEMREIDTKTATAFYNELKSMGKPSEVWNKYLDGTLPSNVDTSKLNGILQSYAEKKGIKIPGLEKKKIIPPTTGTSLSEIFGNKKMSHVYNEMKDFDKSIANKFYKELGSMGKPSDVWNKYLTGELAPDQISRIESLLSDYANKAGLIKKPAIEIFNPKSIVGDRKMSNIYNELKGLDTKTANQFYKELKELGKPSEVWEKYLNGEIKNSKIDDIIKKYFDKNKPGKIEPPITINFREKFKDIPLGSIQDKLDNKEYGDLYKALQSMRKKGEFAPEVWQRYLSGELDPKNAEKIEKVLKKYIHKLDIGKPKPTINPKSIVNNFRENFKDTPLSSINKKLDQNEFNELSKVLQSMREKRGESVPKIWQKYLSGELSPENTKKVEEILTKYADKLGIKLPKPKPIPTPKLSKEIADKDWIEKSIYKDKFKNNAKDVTAMRKEVIDTLMDTPEKYRRCFGDTLTKIDFYDDNGKAYYQDIYRRISINLDKIKKRDNSLGTLFHETGHAMDYAYMRLRNPNKKTWQLNDKDRTSQLPSFLSAIEKDLEHINKNLRDLGYHRDIYDNASKGVQDFFSALKPLNDQGPRKGKIPKDLLSLRYNWSHSYAYYTRNDDPMVDAASELFANISGGYGDAKQMKYMKKYFPNSCKEFENIIEEMAKLIKK